jgi:hypothetical protein
MPRPAAARVEDVLMKTDTPSKEAMLQRARLASLIRDRMAKPATPLEEELWQELRAELEKERLTFRS